MEKNWPNYTAQSIDTIIEKLLDRGYTWDGGLYKALVEQLMFEVVEPLQTEVRDLQAAASTAEAPKTTLELLNEAKELAVKLLPSNDYGEDYDAERLYDILEELRSVSPAPELTAQVETKGAAAAALAKFPVEMHTVEHPDNHTLNKTSDRNEDKRKLWQDGYQQALAKVLELLAQKDYEARERAQVYFDVITEPAMQNPARYEGYKDGFIGCGNWLTNRLRFGGAESEVKPIAGLPFADLATAVKEFEARKGAPSKTVRCNVNDDELLPRWYSIDVAPDGYSTIEVELLDDSRAQGGYYPQPDEFVPSNPDLRGKHIPMKAEYIKRWRYHSYKEGWKSPHVSPDDDCEVRVLTTDGKVLRGKYKERSFVFRPNDLADVEGTCMQGRTTFNWNDIYNFIEFWQEINPAALNSGGWFSQGWFSPKCIPDYDCTIDVELVGDKGRVTRGEFKREGNLFVPSGDNESNRHDWGYIRLDNPFQVVRWKLVR